jgi:hypothetical protein
MAEKELKEFWVEMEGWLTVEAESISQAWDAGRKYLKFFGILEDGKTSNIGINAAWQEYGDFALYKVEFSGFLAVDADSEKKAPAVLKRYLVRKGLAKDGTYWSWTVGLVEDKDQIEI